MTDDRLDDEAQYEALDGNPGDAEGDEVRYGLTPLGALALEAGSFAGFGPCAFGSATAVARSGRLPRTRKRATPLFG